MNLTCTGLNHETPLEIRELFAIGKHEIDGVLQRIRSIEGLSEAVVVSTCNRVEFYTVGHCPNRMLRGIRNFLWERTTIEAPLYCHDALSAVRHLFRVVSGLESMVLGETEILGQVKQAYAAAVNYGATARMLNRLFQNAFRVAKSVRSETQITRGPTSIGSVAVELAGKIFGNLDHRRVMILGAGETSELTARYLVARGVRTIIVANRTFDRAAQLAEEIGGLAVHFDHWQNVFTPDIDIVISSTAAPHPILTCQKLAPILKQRANRPLFIIDLAVPRDAEPALHTLEGVFLYDLDSLKQIAQQSLMVRQQELSHCERIIETHVGNFASWLNEISFQ